MYVQCRKHRGRDLVFVAPEGWVGDPPLVFHVKELEGLISQLQEVQKEVCPPQASKKKSSASKPQKSTPKAQSTSKSTSKTTSKTTSKSKAEPQVPKSGAKAHRARVEDPGELDVFSL